MKRLADWNKNAEPGLEIVKAGHYLLGTVTFSMNQEAYGHE
jgi:hypothetical protein